MAARRECFSYRATLAALRHFDPTLADNWASLLAEPAAQAGWLAPPYLAGTPLPTIG